MAILAAYMVPHPPMIVPSVGKGSEEQIRKTASAYEEVAREIADLRPETILILSPHAPMYADYFSISGGKGAKGSFSDFRAPGVTFEEEYDTELIEKICNLSKEREFPAGLLGQKGKSLDHGTMVPLWFIRRKTGAGKIIRIGLSGLPLTDHYFLGMILRDAVAEADRRVVIVASGDLSHKLKEYGPYGYAAEGPLYDERIMDVCERAAFEELFDFDEVFCEKAAECGHRSFVILAGAFDGTAVRARALSHEDVTGVGYGICTFHPNGPDPGRHFLADYLSKKSRQLKEKQEREDAYVRLARSSLTSKILTGKSLEMPADLPPEMMTDRAGVFVSIHEHGKLRGCIGTIAPTTDCIAKEIIENAVSASTMDPRFDPIREEELPYLEIHVDVLGKPEAIEGPDELDVKRYGVIVTSGSRRGLLLPDLDGVDTVEEQIAIASRKAGIRPDEEIRLERFEVIRHE